jgi:hypothetical protein
MKKLFEVVLISSMFGIATADETSKTKAQGLSAINSQDGMAFGASYQHRYNQTNQVNQSYVPDLPKAPQPAAGVGYAYDTAMMAQSKCFNFDSSTRGPQSADLHVGEAVSTEYLSSLIGEGGGGTVGYNGFSVSGAASYLKAHEETEKSYSLHYFYKLHYDRIVKYPLATSLLLNETGKRIYNNGNNPEFRILCGDRLVDSWEEGAIVISTVKFDFNSSEDKKTFTQEVGAGLTDLAKIGTTFTQIAINKKINVQMSIEKPLHTKHKIWYNNILMCLDIL